MDCHACHKRAAEGISNDNLASISSGKGNRTISSQEKTTKPSFSALATRSCKPAASQSDGAASSLKFCTRAVQ